VKIVLVSGHQRSWDTGAGLVYLHLDEGLRRLGHEVTLFTPEDFLSTAAPGRIRRLMAPRSLERRVRSAVKAADVVEVAGGLGWRLFSALRARPSGRPPLLVTRIHGLEMLDEQARFIEEIAGSMKLSWKYKLVTRRWTNWQEFQSIALSDLVVCYTSRDLDAIVLRGLKAESDVARVAEGFDPSYLQARKHSGLGSRLLWWGTWLDRKGISAVPRALELVSRSVPQVTLTIGGSRMAPDKVLAAFAPHVRSRVSVLPFVSRERHRELLMEHDIFVFPSLSEGFGLALAEAMGSEMACVTTLTGLAHDWLEHGQNCLIVPMSSPTGLSRAVTRLAHDAELRQVLGANAGRTVRELSWGRFARETEAAYEARRARLMERD